MLLISISSQSTEMYILGSMVTSVADLYSELSTTVPIYYGNPHGLSIMHPFELNPQLPFI